MFKSIYLPLLVNLIQTWHKNGQAKHPFIEKVEKISKKRMGVWFLVYNNLNLTFVYMFMS